MSRKSELIRLELWIDPAKLAEVLKMMPIEADDQANAEDEDHDSGEKKTKNPLPVKKIFELYKEKCPDLTQHRILTTALQTAIRQRYLWVMRTKRFSASTEAIAWFETFFDIVHQTDFLNGRKDGQKGWKADLNWLMNETNFDKILSGRY
jgi:hypothetical protein